MTTGTLIELQANFKALNLSSMARNLEGSLRQARESGIGYDEFLIELTATELQARAENTLNRRIREAKFPLLKPMETFDLSAVPELDLRLFRDLAGGGYIREHRNVIFSGHSGAGKTHMAIALGIEACKNNFRTRFVTCYGLVNELIEARQERALQRIVQRYIRYDLLILDELGYIPFWTNFQFLDDLLDRFTAKTSLNNLGPLNQSRLHRSALRPFFNQQTILLRTLWNVITFGHNFYLLPKSISCNYYLNPWH
jgi:DNA replication protein DnaC